MMRRAYASGFLVLAMSLAACGATMRPRAPGNEALRSQIEALGLEGRTYVHDLGQASSIYVHDVHRIGDDLLLEDIHGRVTYLDGGTLNVRWEYYGLDEPFAKRPTHTPSAVMGMSGGKLHVLTRDAGIPDPPPRRVEVIPSSAPVANDTTFYVPTYPTPAGNRTMYSVSLGSGYIGWGHRTRSPIAADMAKGGPGGGDTIYFATTTGEVYAFPMYESTEADPQPAWTAHALSGVRKDLVVDGDDLGVVTDDHRLICYDRITGQVRWTAYPDPGEAAHSSAQFSSSHVFYRRGNALHAFDRETGTPAWSCPGARRFIAARDDFVLLDGGDHTVIKVDAATGEPMTKSRFPGVLFPTQPMNNGTIHAITQRGLLIGVEHGW